MGPLMDYSKHFRVVEMVQKKPWEAERAGAYHILALPHA